MLRAENRLTRQEGFATTLRKGGKSGNNVLVVSVLPVDDDRPTRAGIIVGKRQVPHSSARNRIKRRLRPLVQSRLTPLPRGSTLVVRALGGADNMSSEELGRNLDRLLALALKKSRRPKAVEVPVNHE